MRDSDRSRESGEDRPKQGNKNKLIQRRPRVTTSAALIMSLAFALVASLLAASDSLLWSSGLVTFEAGEPAPMTLRVSPFSTFRAKAAVLEGGAIVIARGEQVTPEQAALAREIIAASPAGWPALGAYMVVFCLLALLYTTQLARSHRGRLLRTQAVTLLLLLGGAVVFKLLLAFTPLSIMLVPVAGAAIIATLVVDVSAGLATGLMASVLIGLLVPFDVGGLSILAVQACSAVLFLGERNHKNRHVVMAGLVSAATSVVAYVVMYYLATGTSALQDLADPTRSTVVAAACGGLLSAGVAILAQPVYQFLLGDITRNKLVELEDLSNPMLQQIARDSPGTWQHSLAMANMAEIAANAIGANGRLVRVGAYYHDLGKSLQPKYFIENLEPGEPSPHDDLSPEVSCDAIFAHVTEGIRVARKRGLPERIIDFMHMHHGDGLLEYFWAKCKESGNPKGLTAEDFRYPGIPPQSRETAILAIVDAVEAASRTLKSSDDKSISSLVQRIVYGKLHLGQLDESGLSMADLRKISNSLRETIKHQRHGRIEYPWQRQEREARAREREDAEMRQSGSVPKKALEPAFARQEESITTTQRFLNEPRLDSLDVPRPYWRDPRSQRMPVAEVAAARESSPGLAHGREESAPAPVSHAAPAVPVEPEIEPASVTRRHPPVAVVAPVAPVAPSTPPPAPAPAVEIRPSASVTMAIADAGPAPLPESILAEGSPGPAAPLAPAERPPRADSAIILPKKGEAAPAEEPAARQTLPLVSLGSGAAADSEVENPFPRPSSMTESKPAEAESAAENATRTAPLGSLPQRVPPAPDESRPAATEHPDTGAEFDEQPTHVSDAYLRTTTLAPGALAPKRVPPPPPGSKERKHGSTIELMKHREQTAPTIDEAESEGEDALLPGTMVMGPPPATRPSDARKTREVPKVSPVTIMPSKKS